MILGVDYISLLFQLVSAGGTRMVEKSKGPYSRGWELVQAVSREFS